MVKFVGEFLGRTDFNRAFSHKEYAKVLILSKEINIYVGIQILDK